MHYLSDEKESWKISLAAPGSFIVKRGIGSGTDLHGLPVDLKILGLWFPEFFKSDQTW